MYWYWCDCLCPQSILFFLLIELRQVLISVHKLFRIINVMSCTFRCGKVRGLRHFREDTTGSMICKMLCEL